MDSLTVIIPISPVPSHPDPYVLELTLASIRERLPDVRIMLMFDGVAPALESMREPYLEFVDNMIADGEAKWGNVVFVVFPEHMHQTLMTAATLEHVTTPVILWSEQDTPLVNDIPFGDLIPIILSGEANVIRFSHEALIIPEHQFLMLDPEPVDVQGQPLIRTRQWSGRPHLASTDYYRQISSSWETTPEPWGGRRFIEHIMYGHVSDADPWEVHKVFLYAPEEPHPNGTFVRSLHTDGRRYGADHYDPSVSV